MERIGVQPDQVSEDNASAVLTAVTAEHERMTRQVEALERMIAVIVEGSELTSTDDEHDPEGATIAYERAQATALLRQARSDLDALEVTSSKLKAGQRVLCSVCDGEIDLERLAALPTAVRCIRCAR